MDTIERWPKDIEEEIIDALWDEEMEYEFGTLPPHIIEMIKLNMIYGEPNE